ncbi:MAG: GNAT family N-acetyltransferase [Chitinophagales bacterium]
MNLELKKIKREDKYLLEKMLVEYFREIEPSKIIETEKGEKLDYPYLDFYWLEKDRMPIFVSYNNENIGFVLINNWVICDSFKAEKSVAEFYIEPKYRRMGIGKKVAYELFKKYSSKWEIRQIATNTIAIHFWRNIIEAFTDGNFREIVKEIEEEKLYVQLFQV